MTKKDILDLLHFRHACKEFDPNKKISEQDFDTILQAGRLSPSSFGIEPWKFLVVQNHELREKVREHTWGAKKQLPTCSHYVMILARKSHFMRYNADYVEYYMRDIQKSPDEIRTNRLRVYTEFQKSDFDLANNERHLFDWSSKQTYIALANMMTVAALLGLDSCPVEGFHMENMNKVLQKDFHVDTNTFGLSVMVAFGYRILPQRPKARLPQEDIITWYNE
jgi:nitroreductase